MVTNAFKLIRSLMKKRGGHPGEIKHGIYSEAIHSIGSNTNASFPSNELRVLGTICIYSWVLSLVKHLSTSRN